jgi:catechol 2,3-dioxygenase-like lactoylglutathione lyase family enzyme
MTLAAAHIRIARPTDDIDKLLPFYCDGLGFEVLGRFADHEGFDGVMLGHPDSWPQRRPRADPGQPLDLLSPGL